MVGNNKNNSGCGSTIFWLVIALLVSALCVLQFELVINSDMPDWLKYLILS